MTAQNQLWGLDFPEREDLTQTGSVAPSAYADIGAPSGPIMVELTSTDRLFVFRGPLAPPNDVTSLVLPPSTLTRIEMTVNDRRIWVRAPGRNTIQWAARIWLRYERFVAPRLPQLHRGRIQGDSQRDVYWFSHGLGRPQGIPPNVP